MASLLLLSWQITTPTRKYVKAQILGLFFGSLYSGYPLNSGSVRKKVMNSGSWPSILRIKQTYCIDNEIFNCFVTRGVTRGSRGAQFPRRQMTMGPPNHYTGRRKVPTMSQVLSSIQRISSERPHVPTWGAKVASCPGRHLTSLCSCS